MANISITQDDIRARASTQSFSRGQDYYRDNSIVNPVRRGNTLDAQCYGSMVYRVQATLNDTGIVSTSCTCPYDWGGDCKHIVALLLTYLQEPDVFSERLPLKDALQQHSKDQLIDVILKMIQREPDLQTLVDMPVPSDNGSAIVNTQSLRRNLEYALSTYGGWGDHTAEIAVYDAIERARDFEIRDDYANAVRIYCAVLEECSAIEYLPDDDGGYAEAVNEAVAGLGNCLSRSSVADDDALRQESLHALLDVFIREVEYGGIDFGYEANNLLIEHIRPDDIPEIRQRIIDEQQKKAESAYSSWSVETYENLLIRLDAMDTTDPEETLRRLRDGGMYLLLVKKLLELDRDNEALRVIDEHLVGDFERLRALHVLDEYGYTDAAIDITEQTLAESYDSQIVDWLIRQYQHRDNAEDAYRWQLRRMRENPSQRFYADLMTTAQQLSNADDTRQNIIQYLETQNRFDVLTRIYLHDENWDAAWDTVEKVSTSNDRWGWHYSSLRFTVAEQSRHARPRRAIPVYIEAARKRIGQRQRKHYAIAADYLSTVRDLYRQIDEDETWQTRIREIRSEFKNLPALQDELNKAGL